MWAVGISPGVNGAGWEPAPVGGTVPHGGGVGGGPVIGLPAAFESPFCGWSQWVILFPWPSLKALQTIKIQSIVAQMAQPQIKNPSRIPKVGW